VADVQTEGPPNHDLVGHLAANTFALMLPVRSRGMQRLIGILPDDAPPEPDFDTVRPILEPLFGIRVEQVNWFSTYRVHHRVAAHFRVSRCFLSGDAAHIHSPAGGQGMNTGIGDAINLAWKLAHVLQGRANAGLLDTYEAERIVFARKLVATTDRAFQLIVSQGTGGQLLRHWLLPHVAPVLSGFAAARRTLFKTVSQVLIHYPDSPLSGGRAGEVIGGDRLPGSPPIISPPCNRWTGSCTSMAASIRCWQPPPSPAAAAARLAVERSRRPRRPAGRCGLPGPPRYARGAGPAPAGSRRAAGAGQPVHITIQQG
jgi:hypothetical protein